MSEQPMMNYEVTCHTEACENATIPLRVLATVDDPRVICGPCAQPITDISAVAEPTPPSLGRGEP